ncbi:hypothetical protein SARC_00146 [Sphaeroforma arctica JP610]|uniref:Uncharacterized protein n=1 Tax=Sphaeroforma arctica JP610 TaxID=667725 RepID=A0A0L0GFZ1_9EUKA|nr:hypothetical protein SARC_00146 [Sphaeroforma arctica JP610]KNC87774.1 hypothetical protein SARC_00146 [Sphaeroforma arctica JP610]|eukprot:XP_014161676.1 hypothetical protein SARC_00146 [Sphaeroforma arctica JP610]
MWGGAWKPMTCVRMAAEIFLEFNSHQGDGLCTCPWYNTHALCPLDSKQHLIRKFTTGFETPDHQLDDALERRHDPQPVDLELVKQERLMPKCSVHEEEDKGERQRMKQSTAMYRPLLSFKDAQRAYAEAGITFDYLDVSKPRANLRHHIDRLRTVKTALNAMRSERRRRQWEQHLNNTPQPRKAKRLLKAGEKRHQSDMGKVIVDKCVWQWGGMHWDMD